MNRLRTSWKTVICAAGLLALVSVGCGKVYEEEQPPRDFTIAAGSQIQVTPTEGLGPDVPPGTRFAGVLYEPVELEGQLVAPKGSPVVGQIVEMPSTDAEAESENPLAVELTSLTVYGGQSFPISTVPVLQPETTEDPEGKPVKEWETMTFTLNKDAELSLSIDLLDAATASM